MAEPYIWLRDDEPEGQADCGCILQAEYDGAEDDGHESQCGNPALFQCPLHAAAPELLAACEAAAAHFDGTDAPTGVRLRAAIAKARGLGQNVDVTA